MVIFLKIVALGSREVTPAISGKSLAIVLTGIEDSFASGRVAGQDLTNLSSRWLQEALSFKEVRWTEYIRDFSGYDNPDVILVTYDWLLENDHSPFRSAAKLAIELRRLHAPAFVILPDGFRLTTTAMGSLIVAIAGGSQIVLQDSVYSHRKFGTVRPTGPHFWTWPTSHLDVWMSPKRWSDREKLALIAGTGGGPFREAVMGQIEPRLNSVGYQTRRTDNRLSWPAYIDTHRQSRFVVTTCKMQPEYRVGPRYYQRLIPESVVTGRVWEALASGNVLITDENPILESLGFEAGNHYLPLPNLLETDWSDWRLPSEETLATIAHEGNLHFRRCVEGRKASDVG